MEIIPKIILSQIYSRQSSQKTKGGGGIFLRVIFTACLFTLINVSASFAAFDDARGFRVAADLLNQGSYLEALGAYQEIVTYSESYENRAKGLLFMGAIYSLYLDQYDEALRLYSILMRDYSKSSFAQDALFNIGMVFYEKGNFEQAYESFKRYLSQYTTGKHRKSAEVWAESAKAEMVAEKPRLPEPLSGLAVKDTTLRVLVRGNASSVTFNTEGLITISDPFSGKIVHARRGPFTLTARTGRILANQEDLNLSQCIVAANQSIIALDVQPYRGSFRVLAENDGKIKVINYVELEEYLYGVVPREMSPGWPQDALKAQAVAARSYALYVKGKSSDKPYDLVATTASQVYGGYGAESPTSTRAVDATGGEVMTYEGRLVVAYFHANSGGFTEGARSVWVADLPYLTATPDPYSDNIPGGTWDLSLSYQDIQDRLNQYGLSIGTIYQVSPVDISSSGRPLRIVVVSSRGRIELKSNDFRLKIGAMKLRSTRLRIHKTTDGLRINGNGLGHGVGMSQWGAYRMAQTGYDYRDILTHYYKGVQIKRIGHSNH